MSKRGETVQTKHIYFLPLVVCLIDLIYFQPLADPLNPIKFWVLGLLALFALGLVVSDFLNIRSAVLGDSSLKIATVLILLFVSSLLFAFFFTEVKSIGLIGFHGRNTGLLFYIFLCIIFLHTSLRFEFNQIKYFYITLVCMSIFFGSYGGLQHFNIDFVQWDAPFNKIVLTIGNPDFSAALLAIFIATIFPLAFIKLSNLKRAILFVLIVFVSVVIYWTNARQGLIGLLAGISFTLFIVLWQRSRKLGLAFSLLGLGAGLIAILGTLQVGPLKTYLYKASVNDRGYDWRAAWHMFTSHPWTGVGIDRYAAYFFKYQDSKYPLIYGNTQLVNNAHSDYLQFFATGGIFLGCSYIFLTLFIGWRALKVINSYKDEKQILVSGVIAGWIVFVAQSLISPDNLSVTIWGWLLAGIIVALSLPENITTRPPLTHKSKINSTNRAKGYSATLVLVLTFLFTIVVPMYKGESRVVSFLKINPTSINTSQLRSAYLQLSSQAFNTPLLSPDYKVRIAFNITNAGLVDEGKLYFEQILKQDPKKSDAPQFLAEIYESQKNYPEAIKYRVATREVYPWNTANLFGLESDYLAIGDKNSAKAVRDSIIAMAPGTENALKADKAIGG